MAINVQPDLRAFDGLPEIDIEGVLEVRAALRRLRLLGATRTAEELPEQVAEPESVRVGLRAGSACRPGSTSIFAEIEPAKPHVRTTTGERVAFSAVAGHCLVRVKSVLVVHLALLRVTKNLIGFQDVLEALFGGFVTRIQIWMVLTRQFLVRFPDIVL
jgi:hypothetical protein